MTTPQIISHWGYAVEEHDVLTKDGYILTLHRIPYGVRNPDRTIKRPVMFLQHGLLGSSAQWVTNLPGQSAGFVFADAGFDVWMGNFRGNAYSKGHKILTPSDSAYWRFSWDEMAEYDLPAMIDFVRNVTEQEKIYYIGHSMGTMTMFARATLHPEWADNFHAYFAIAPVAKTHNIKGLLHYVARISDQIGLLSSLLGIDEFLPSNKLVKWVAKYVCGSLGDNPVCNNVFFLTSGPNTAQMNATRMPVYLSHFPSGTSTWTLLHFAQGVHTDEFQMYDFGRLQNVLRYGQFTPTTYNMSAYNLPVYLFSGDQDWLAEPTDVLWLEQNLNGHAKCHYKFQDYNHIDFIWGQQVKFDVYDRILEIIRRNGTCVWPTDVRFLF
jgi:pimeloyl-ACP methyl ester carboxylesterase